MNRRLWVVLGGAAVVVVGFLLADFFLPRTLTMLEVIPSERPGRETETTRQLRRLQGEPWHYLSQGDRVLDATFVAGGPAGGTYFVLVERGYKWGL